MSSIYRKSISNHLTGLKPFDEGNRREQQDLTHPIANESMWIPRPPEVVEWYEKLEEAKKLLPPLLDFVEEEYNRWKSEKERNVKRERCFVEEFESMPLCLRWILRHFPIWLWVIGLLILAYYVFRFVCLIRVLPWALKLLVASAIGVYTFLTPLKWICGMRKVALGMFSTLSNTPDCAGNGPPTEVFDAAFRKYNKSLESIAIHDLRATKPWLVKI